MIEITPQLSLPETDLRWSFSHSGGPGGQNVNKVATRVTLRLRIEGNPSFPEPLRDRLLQRLAPRLTKEGELLLHVDDTRQQLRNREIALERLISILREGLHRPRARRPTKPTRASRERRLTDKRRRSETKQRRRSGGD